MTVRNIIALVIGFLLGRIIISIIEWRMYEAD